MGCGGDGSFLPPILPLWFPFFRLSTNICCLQLHAKHIFSTWWKMQARVLHCGTEILVEVDVINMYINRRDKYRWLSVKEWWGVGLRMLVLLELDHIRCSNLRGNLWKGKIWAETWRIRRIKRLKSGRNKFPGLREETCGSRGSNYCKRQMRFLCQRPGGRRTVWSE